LSETLWQLCEEEESARTAAEAVGVIEALPAEGPELAWAYANRADRLWYAGRPEPPPPVQAKPAGGARKRGARSGHPGVTPAPRAGSRW
jgi:hypothetical protein